MLSLGGARGVEKAELNGNVDSDNNHGGSSRTYVLHRTGCSQEDDQLLRQGCKRSGSPGRQGWGNAMGTRRLDKRLFLSPGPWRWKQRFSPAGFTITYFHTRSR